MRRENYDEQTNGRNDKYEHASQMQFATSSACLLVCPKLPKLLKSLKSLLSPFCALLKKKLIKVRSTISYLRNFRYLCCMNNQRGYTPAQLSARCHEHEVQVNDALVVCLKNIVQIP